MVQKTKTHIHRHRKLLTIAGVFIFASLSVFLFTFHIMPARSDSGIVYPNGTYQTGFQNCVGASCVSGHWAVLDEITYNSSDYIYTGTAGSGGESDEFHMTSVAGSSDSVSQVSVSFQAYAQGGCQGGDCDTIDVRIFIDNAYTIIQTVTLSSIDTLRTVNFFGSWAGDDDLRVELTRQVQGGGSPGGMDDDARIGRVYATVTYSVFVNSAPTISSVTDSPDPVTTGDVITFEIQATDPEVDNTGAAVCKTNSISASGGVISCPGGSWGPIIGTGGGYQTLFLIDYTAQSADEGTSPNSYYAFVCDEFDNCSASTSGTFGVIPNEAPTLNSVADSPDQVSVGGQVQFDIFWNDANTDDAKGIICKTDSVNAGVNPTCPGGTWVGPSPLTGTSPINLFYTTGSGDVGTNNYFGFACDDTGLCSSAGDPNGGTFEVTGNNAPTISSVTDSPDPVTTGDVITFEIQATDPEVDNTGAAVCKTNSISASGGVISCPGGSWGPIIGTGGGYQTLFLIDYTAQAANEGTSPNSYYAFVCDEFNACSASTSGMFGVVPFVNSAPSVTSVSDFPDPVAIGSNISFTVNLDDPNGDEVGVIICKSDLVASSGGVVSCPGGAWSGPIYPGSVSQAGLSYTAQAADEGTSPNNYYAFVCDPSDECSSSTDPNEGQFTVTSGAVGNNVSGYIWSSNIGWISLNCSNTGTCGTSDYGVNVDSATGDFSGYAWSSNIGWISFNRADTGNPPEAPFNGGSGPIAQLSGGNVTGWTRALANGGGWDGWIKLACTTECGTSNYNVTLNTVPDPDEFTGWAWGDDVVGWVNFNCLDQGVCASSNYAAVITGFNTPPEVVPGSPAVSFSASSGPSCISRERFVWDFVDNEDGSSQSAYQLQVSNDSGFSSIQFDSGIVASGAKERFITISSTPVNEFADGIADGDGQLAFYENRSASYYWRVKVGDSGGALSDWENGPSFRTSLHPYPAPDFTRDPLNPSEGEEVQFTDLTTFFVINLANRSWSWSIQDASYVGGTTSASQNPQVMFDSNGSKTAVLTATDLELSADANSGNGQCSITKGINVQLPLPEFREIPPVGFLESILSKLLGFLGIDSVFAYFN